MSILDSLTVTRIDEIFTVPSAKGRTLKINERSFFGLSFCSDNGVIAYHTKECSYVSDKAHAILLPMGGTYHLSGLADGHFPLINFKATCAQPISGFHVFSLRHTDGYLHDYERMLSLYRLGGHEQKLMSMLYDMLYRLSKESEPRQTHLLTPALDTLDTDFSNPELSVSHLASLCGVSDAHFRKLFKESQGTSPKQYLTELRISHAKRLLSERTATVSDIAEACGFASVYHFCRAFKLATGQTPTEFAER